MSTTDPNREDLNTNNNEEAEQQSSKEPTGDRDAIKWDEVRPLYYSTAGQVMMFVMASGVIAACIKYLFFCQCAIIR